MVLMPEMFWKYSLSDKAKADYEAISADIAGGTPRADAVAKYDTDENFSAWVSVAYFLP